jgi:hypothetical protein
VTSTAPRRQGMWNRFNLNLKVFFFQFSLTPMYTQTYVFTDLLTVSLCKPYANLHLYGTTSCNLVIKLYIRIKSDL